MDSASPYAAPVLRRWSLLWRVAVCGLLAVPAAAQFVQQGGKLVGSGVGDQLNKYGWQGYSVALSRDGNTAIVGGPNDNFTKGAAWIFTRSGEVWTQQGPKLVGSGTVGIGWQALSVAISADGNTAMVGAFADNSAVGAAWVFTRSGETWTQQGGKLVASGAVGSAHQGVAVALSADGDTVLIGGSGDNGFTGAAWVFTRSGGVWTQQGPKLTADGMAGRANLGISVALSGDGNTALVGGPIDNSQAGAAWVFTRSGSVWTGQGPKLTGSDVAGPANLGAAVALSDDGNIALVGGPKGLDGGAAWVFKRSAGAWKQQGAKLTVADTGATYLGSSVALSGDGNTALIGAPFAGVSGAAWVFARNGGAWIEGSKLVGSGSVGYASQGDAVALAGDGYTAMVGGHWDNVGIGAVWAFTPAMQLASTMNNYSYIQPGEPNYGIAQGSIFSLFGSNMAASSTSLQNVPLKTSLHGATVNVTMNGVTTHPPLYYVAPGQIAGILPSNTPIGTGQITVTDDRTNWTSAPLAIRVVESAFGILTLDGSGSGVAAALDANGAFLGTGNAANPNDYITLWGSGLGPVSGDETMLQTQQDMTGVPIEVLIGDQRAEVTYHGRSLYPGLDQINVVVPPGVQGCSVPVRVLSGSESLASNLVTIPVAGNGRACSK